MKVCLPERSWAAYGIPLPNQNDLTGKRLARRSLQGGRNEVIRDDVRGCRAILEGSDTAATEYFKKKTSGQLTAAFRPIVESSMNETGVNQKHKTLSSQLPSLPFGHTQVFDINSCVISKSLDGLFYVLGQEGDPK